MGRNLGNPPFATRESLPKVRERELEDACRAIGIRKMGLRDKTVEFEPHDQMDNMIKNLIEETNPSLIHSILNSQYILTTKRLPKLSFVQLVACQNLNVQDLHLSHLVTTHQIF